MPPLSCSVKTAAPSLSISTLRHIYATSSGQAQALPYASELTTLENGDMLAGREPYSPLSQAHGNAPNVMPTLPATLALAPPATAKMSGLTSAHRVDMFTTPAPMA